MFYLSRTVVELIAPFPFSLALLFLTLFLLVLRKIKLGVLCLSLALFLQIFCGYGFLARQQIIDQEAVYPAVTDAGLLELKGKQFNYIVVLGSGHVSDSRLSAVSQLGGSSLYRLIEGVRLLQLKPHVKLVLSGGIGYDPVANAEVVGRVAESIGVPKERIIVENRPRDTLQEAEMLLPLLGREEFVLVTSAMHMPRAMKIFHDRGMHPIAAPTDYVMKREVVEPPGSLFPSAGNLDLSKRLFYEWLAELWMNLKKSAKKISG